jgi:hypothetical protein
MGQRRSSMVAFKIQEYSTPYLWSRVKSKIRSIFIFFPFNFSYIGAVQNYFHVLLQVIKPLLYKNGGPILMVQIENEYGSLGIEEYKYKKFLRDLVWQYLGSDTVLYTGRIFF